MQRLENRRKIDAGREMEDQPARNWHRQFKTLMPVMLLAYLPTLAVLVGVVIFALAMGRNVWFFTNDPFVLGKLPFYAGILSNVGILLWCSVVAICFFAAVVLKGDDQWRYWKPFLLMSGLFTSLLLFDDLFQLHRIFNPKYLFLTSLLAYFVYGLLSLWYLGCFRKQILETEFLLMLFALSFFVLAVVFDTLPLLPRGRTAFSDRGGLGTSLNISITERQVIPLGRDKLGDGRPKPLSKLSGNDSRRSRLGGTSWAIPLGRDKLGDRQWETKTVE